MDKLTLLAIVERGKGKGNFSCFATEGIGNYSLAGYGCTAREAMEDIQRSRSPVKWQLRQAKISPRKLNLNSGLMLGRSLTIIP